ncbi:MAG: spermidine synthase, partial [Myxococcota bacterium]|nr:spermidine synthase [Myxococcota bacterium]
MIAPIVPLLALSGAAALCGEVVWMRRLALATGSTGLAMTLTLSGYMAGLGMGGAWAGRRRWTRPPLGYGVLELLSAAWLLAFPSLVAAAQPLLHGARGVSAITAAALVLPAGVLHGATLPAVSAALSSRAGVGHLYASNTAGAVLGVLAGTFFLLPAAGLRGTELAAAAAAGAAGCLALLLANDPPARPAARFRPSPWAPGVLVAAAVAGGV